MPLHVAVRLTSANFLPNDQMPNGTSDIQANVFVPKKLCVALNKSVVTDDGRRQLTKVGHGVKNDPK